MPSCCPFVGAPLRRGEVLIFFMVEIWPHHTNKIWDFDNKCPTFVHFVSLHIQESTISIATATNLQRLLISIFILFTFICENFKFFKKISCKIFHYKYIIILTYILHKYTQISNYHQILYLSYPISYKKYS